MGGGVAKELRENGPDINSLKYRTQIFLALKLFYNIGHIYFGFNVEVIGDIEDRGLEHNFVITENIYPFPVDLYV